MACKAVGRPAVARKSAATLLLFRSVGLPAELAR